MQIRNLLTLFLLCCLSCNSNNKQDRKYEKFDKVKWATQYGDDYSHRDKMLSDLIANEKLKGLTKEELLTILGQPDRVDSGYLFYKVVQTRIGLFPLHTKTFVIKLAKDNTVEWRKIHE